MKFICTFIAALLLLAAPIAGQADGQPQTVIEARASPFDSLQISAHRGGRYIPGYPENALETFQYLLDSIPAIIECDVNMSADSFLLMMHDRSLDRTTTGTGMVKQHNWADMKTLQLVDDFGEATPFKVPSLDEVLEWSVGKAFLTLDVKRGVPFELVVDAVQRAGVEQNIAVITYNFEDALKVYTLDPSLMLSVSIRNEEELQRYLESPIPPQQMYAFTGLTAREPAFYQKLKQAGFTIMLGTIGNLDKRAEARGPQIYRELMGLGVDILATDRPVAAYEALTEQTQKVD
jgi:glycerophosphoryl diester phosphodiesterase